MQTSSCQANTKFWNSKISRFASSIIQEKEKNTKHKWIVSSSTRAVYVIKEKYYNNVRKLLSKATYLNTKFEFKFASSKRKDTEIDRIDSEATHW